MHVGKKPVALIILDGWGIRFAHRGNAIRQGYTPNFDNWLKEYECSILDASGKFVGLGENQMGNSEVGHLNLGAGRIVLQDVSRIDQAIKTKHLEELLSSSLNNNSNKLHLVGLLGNGGIHAQDRHLYSILKYAQKIGVMSRIHIITDGRDTSPTSGKGFLLDLINFINQENINAKIATVSGRYYAMDRDKRWERTQKAYEAMINREGEHAKSPVEAIESSYKNKITDEFILPTVIDNCENCSVEPGDSIFFFNFRADRMRQIVEMFSSEEISKQNYISNLNILTMTNYQKDLEVQVLFPMEIVSNTLSEFLAKNNISQLHIAESEKYAHVTYFFNGRNEKPFIGEERILVPSPKIATYDLKPEMSAYEVTQIVMNRLENESDDFILLNFANPDMIGHTGKLDAARKAVEVVDECAGKIVDTITSRGGVAVVTADHGNAELLYDLSTGGPHTYHTTSPVPFFVISQEKKFMLHPRGKLADVAPTIIDLFGLKPPSCMSGKSLIWENKKSTYSY